MIKIRKIVDQLGTLCMGASGAFLYLEAVGEDGEFGLEAIVMMFAGLTLWLVSGFGNNNRLVKQIGRP